MSTWLLDANVLLRFLTCDMPLQAEAARALLISAAEGRVELRMTDLAFAEVVWVLDKVYQWRRDVISARLVDVLRLSGLTVDHADVLERALAAYTELNVDFIDAFQAELARRDGVEIIVSYDRDFDRMTWISRREP